MTADERDLTPEEEAELTRLLGDAGGPVPTPPEVVARLDDVLAGLVADRAAAGSGDADPDAEADLGSSAGPAAVPAGDATVVSLEARRRRRWPKALLAAAAVVVGGYAVTAGLTSTMSGNGDSAITADESTAGGAESAGSESAGSESADSGTGGDAGGQAMESPGRDLLGRVPANATMLRDRPPLVRSDRLAADVTRVLSEADRASERSATTMADEVLARAASACVPVGLGPDDAWYLVRYDGRRAALVTAATEDGTVRASVVGCDGEPLAEVTVPTP